MMILISCAFLLASCEGFKVLTLTNSSGGNATVTIKPEIPDYSKDDISTYPQKRIGDSSRFVLSADSSKVIFSTFTTMLFGSRIKPSDLRINYLRIETEKDTITADSKEKIVDLIHDKRTRYRPEVDKPMTDGKNFGNIMIR